MTELIITRPDDMHVHLRDDVMLKQVAHYTSRQFARAIVMPNLKPPITTVQEADAYRDRILNVIPKSDNFDPLMTLYLTASTSIVEIEVASKYEHVYAFKLYPSGATTNSDAGVPDIKKVYHLFEAMEFYNVPLLIHGEVTEGDIFDRERIFIDRYLVDIVKQFPELRIVFEHATTKEAIQFVKDTPDNVAATITPQHLMYNRNSILVGGIKPHYYCLPILKREEHRLALVEAAISGNPKFFLGTDSAPHVVSTKENSCGCAGCFSAPIAMELYAEIFEEHNALDKLEGFASHFGADFYHLPRNVSTLTLKKIGWEVPEFYGKVNSEVKPLRANTFISWRVV